MPPTLTAGPGELLLAVNAVRQERSAQCFSQCLIKPNGRKMTSKNSLCQIPTHPYPQGWVAGSGTQRGNSAKLQSAEQVGLFLLHQNKTSSDHKSLMKLLICACSARCCKRQTRGLYSTCWVWLLGKSTAPCQLQAL